VMPMEGSQVFVKSYIEGATDFIFGQRAVSWFEAVDIGVVEAGLGYITGKPPSSPSSDLAPSFSVLG